MAVRRSRKVYNGATDLRNRRETVYVSPTLIAQFEMNRRGIAKIAVGEDLQDAVHSLVVQQAMPYAISISPRGDTLNYVSSWRAADGFTVVAGMRRAACKLVNVSGHAAAVEWGRGGKQGILGRTLAHLNGTSPIAVEKAARKVRRKAFDPDLHRRGPGGRFAAKRASPEELRRRGQRAQQIRNP